MFRLETELRRGIAPRLLRDQVRNTAPFIFSDTVTPAAPGYYGLLLSEEDNFSHEDYFKLCVSAHWATCSTFVPTDVDQTIRLKLWSPGLPLETLSKMVATVFEALEWDIHPVSTRWVRTHSTNQELNGHAGEWFSIAAAAYGALRRRETSLAADIASRIVVEVQREANVIETLYHEDRPIELLKASTLVSHNLGDLDRVIDAWNLPEEDPLRRAVYKLGHGEGASHNAWLIFAGALNKRFTADENHRHFALRKPRALRRHRELLLGVGPFFDSWGERVAMHPALSESDHKEIIEALVEGWEKLPKTVGYARALSGLLERIPGGMSAVRSLTSSKTERALKSGALRVLCSVPRRRFEDQWSHFVDAVRAPQAKNRVYLSPQLH